MFDTILGKINGLLSTSFWIANFLPVAIVAFLHTLLAAAVFDQPSLDKLGDANFGGAAETGGLVLLLLVAAAYALAPLVSLFHGLLDGSLLPERLHNALYGMRLREWTSARERLARTAKAGSDATSFAQKAKQRLKESRNAGTQKGIADAAAIAAAQAALKQYQKNRVARLIRLDFKAPDRLSLLGDAVSRLESALRANTTDPAIGWKKAAQQPASGAAALSPDEAAQKARLLDSLHVRLRDFLDRYASEQDYLSEATKRRNPIDLKVSEATRLGDARRQVEAYSSQAYCADFAWLWPRLQLVITTGEGDTLSARLSQSSAQLDFAVLLLVLVQSVPLVWLALLPRAPGWTWLALAIAATWPLLSAALYEVVVRAQLALGGITKTVIDAYRLDLLGSLHQVRPVTLAAERALWARLCDAAVPNLGVDLVYAPPARTGQ
jgi:hypothetical protein